MPLIKGRQIVDTTNAIKGRQIVDVTSIVNEFVDSIVKRKLSDILSKLNIEKAYDYVN